MVRLLGGVGGGVAVAIMVGFLGFLLDRIGFNLAGLVFFLVLPVGAFLIGYPAAFAFSYISWNQAKSGREVLGAGLALLIGAMVLGAATLFAYHCFLFSDLGYFRAGSTFQSAFVDYFGGTQMRSRFGEYTMGPNLGYLSYGAAALGGMAGISGAGVSPSSRLSRLTEIGKSVATLAVLLGEVDGELDADEITCGRYTTKLAMEEFADRAFGVSKKQAAGMVDSVYGQAQRELNRDLLFTEAVDQSVSTFSSADAVMKELILFGLAAVVAKNDMDNVNREQIILLGYIGKALGHDKKNWKQTFAYGMSMREQILTGKLK